MMNFLFTHTDAMDIRIMLETGFPSALEVYEVFLDDLIDGHHHVTMAGHC